MDQVLLVFYLRPARLRARTTAIAEALSLLRGLGAAALPGGPLSEQGGVFWVTMPRDRLEVASARLQVLGYSYAVDLAEEIPERAARSEPKEQIVRWRRRPYRLVGLHEEDPGELRGAAPDRRPFLLETPAGIREVLGYRGDSGTLSRRGLPVPDARMLVNLASAGDGASFLDPFAGAGGIVIEAQERGYRVLSADIDPALRYGLAAMGAAHLVADAGCLPLAGESIDAIATEPPYEPEAEAAVIESLAEMSRVLRPGGRIAMLCADWQAAGMRERAAALGLTAFHEAPIDRKGTPCAVLAWEKG